jgi:hypothetical protein
MRVITGSTLTVWEGDPTEGPATELTVEQADAEIPHTDDDYTAGAVVMPDGRVAIVMVLDDRGDGVPADTGNVNGSSVAAAVRNAYNAAKGV